MDELKQGFDQLGCVLSSKDMEAFFHHLGNCRFIIYSAHYTNHMFLDNQNSGRVTLEDFLGGAFMSMSLGTGMFKTNFLSSNEQKK
jgi:hypothetical protein